MKYLVAAAILSLGLYGLTSAGATAGDGPAQVIEKNGAVYGRPNIGPCGPDPCKPSKPRP